MKITIKTELTARLERLITQYPDCPWVKELFDWHLKERVKPPLKITIDNRYCDDIYDIYASEN